MRGPSTWLLLSALTCALAGCSRAPESAAPESGANPEPRPADVVPLEAVVPDGWAVELREDGDLNADGRTDVLLVLQRTDEAGAPPLRSLAIVLAGNDAPAYSVAATNERLIPRDPSGNMEDPLANGEIAASKGEFQLTLGMMPAIGSYEAATLRFVFRYEPECFRLVRFIRAETHRATLATRDLSVDYLTGEVTETTGNAQSAGETTRSSRLPSSRRHCFSNLPAAWSFDPLQP